MITHNLGDFLKDFKCLDIQSAFFGLPEQRVKIGSRGAIIFEVRPREHGHNVPHIHAEYQGQNISISLMDFSVLAGNLPPKLQKSAIEWTKTHYETCKEKWNDYHKYEVPVM